LRENLQRPGRLPIAGNGTLLDVPLVVSDVGGRSKTSAAGTIGGGLKWAFGRRLSLQAEYLFIEVLTM
jgi:hypothetical protein